MAPTMRPCPSCGRHVKTTERQCPFCSAAMPEGFEQFAYPTLNKRLGRAAIAAFGASLALAGCGNSTMPVTDAAADSASPTDSGTPADTGVASDVMSLPDVPVAAYGLPPQDGGVAPPYGLPPRDE